MTLCMKWQKRDSKMKKSKNCLMKNLNWSQKNTQKGEIRMMEDKFIPKTEDEIIKEVAEEEGLTEEEVREMWELFKKEAREYQEYKRMKSTNATKPKRDKKKNKLKRKNAKKSRKQNRK